MEIITESPEETLLLGEKLGSHLQAKDIVLLFGDLGSGKTTLTQGICYGLGLAKGEYIRSPSFTLINEYQGKLPIFHVDLYRLDSAPEIASLGLEEVFFGQGVTIVEWAEKLYKTDDNEPPMDFGIDEKIEVRLSILGENRRSFSIRGPRPFPEFS